MNTYYRTELPYDVLRCEPANPDYDLCSNCLRRLPPTAPEIRYPVAKLNIVDGKCSYKIILNTTNPEVTND